MKDSLGDRMKTFYENITRMFIHRRTYTIIRLDGKAFHTFTKGLDRPWDDDLILLMDGVTSYLCKNIQGAKFAYTQSDEISIILTDFDKLETDAWFGGNIQKMVSVSASMATYAFTVGMMNLNKKKFYKQDGTSKEVSFDARVFSIPTKTEAINYMVWRQQDAIRNSIQMLAQHLFSAKELHKKNQKMMLQMCEERGKKWENIEPKLQMGRTFYLDVKSTDGDLEQRDWVYDEAPPVFSEKWNYIENILPNLQ